MNLIELLHYLQRTGAPERVIEALERKIERREMRFRRDEQEIREWARERKEAGDKVAKNEDELLTILLLILLLAEDSEEDEFQFSDLIPAARKPPRDPSGFMDDEREAIALPKW